MSDDQTIIYAHTVEQAMEARHRLGLQKGNTRCIGKHASDNAFRGYTFKIGRIILVDDVKLKEAHRRDLTIAFLSNPPILRLKVTGYLS